ncbi:hypothetical protein EfmE980_0813 [Enterococcus faecium E980]|jgi:hypothetical protein|nr:hypothetical protein EfmE980_0813 [Enterococcus faecium E980]MBL4997885.1 hypothetical protein [Enterococcus lactis]MBL5000482.1 hypothetical protein [Enterococcus lactis]SJX70976.1 hypothetical protein FM130_09680 [Enterococcus faecium]
MQLQRFAVKQKVDFILKLGKEFLAPLIFSFLLRSFWVQ